MKRFFKFVLTPDRDGWEVLAGDQRAVIKLPEDSEKVRELALYGLKQVVADGAATPAGTLPAERLAALQERYDAIHSGEWSLRTGVGATGSRSRVPMSEILEIALRVGALRGDREAVTRAWIAASDAARARVVSDPRVQAELRASAPGALEAFM